VVFCAHFDQVVVLRRHLIVFLVELVDAHQQQRVVHVVRAVLLVKLLGERELLRLCIVAFLPQLVIHALQVFQDFVIVAIVQEIAPNFEFPDKLLLAFSRSFKEGNLNVIVKEIRIVLLLLNH